MTTTRTFLCLTAVFAISTSAWAGSGDPVYETWLQDGDDVQAELDALPDDGLRAQVYLLPGTYRGGFHVARRNTGITGCTRQSGSKSTDVTCEGPLPSGDVDAAIIKRRAAYNYQWGESVVGIAASDVSIARLVVDAGLSEETEGYRAYQSLGIVPCVDPAAQCVHRERVDRFVIEDNRFVDTAYIDVGVNDAQGLIRNNDMTRGKNFIGIWVSGSDAPGGGTIRIEGNRIANKGGGGGWGLGITAPTWAQNNCDAAGNCVYGAGTLAVELEDNVIAHVGTGVVMVLQTAPVQSNGIGPHALSLAATNNTFATRYTPLGMFAYRAWMGDGYQVSVLLSGNRSAPPAEAGGVLSVASAWGYPTHTVIDIADLDGILPAAELDTLDCGPADHENAVTVTDGQGNVVASCP